MVWFFASQDFEKTADPSTYTYSVWVLPLITALAYTSCFISVFIFPMFVAIVVNDASVAVLTPFWVIADAMALLPSATDSPSDCILLFIRVSIRGNFPVWYTTNKNRRNAGW